MRQVIIEPTSDISSRDLLLQAQTIQDQDRQLDRIMMCLQDTKMVGFQ
jgi:hypothetical protein